MNRFEQLTGETKRTLAKNLLNKSEFVLVAYPPNSKPVVIDFGLSTIQKMMALEEIGSEWNLPIDEWTSLWESLTKEESNGLLRKPILRQDQPEKGIVEGRDGGQEVEVKGRQVGSTQESKEPALDAG